MTPAELAAANPGIGEHIDPDALAEALAAPTIPTPADMPQHRPTSDRPAPSRVLNYAQYARSVALRQAVALIAPTLPDGMFLGERRRQEVLDIADEFAGFILRGRSTGGAS